MRSYKFIVMAWMLLAPAVAGLAAGKEFYSAMSSAFEVAGPTTSFAGSYDGSFTLDGATPAGTLTFVIRQNDANIVGRMGHVFLDGGCRRTSEFEAAVEEGFFETTARSLDGSKTSAAIQAVFLTFEKFSYLYGFFTTRDCETPQVTGEFLLLKLEGANPPNVGGPYVGEFWNNPDAARLPTTLFARRTDRDIQIDRITVTTPIGPISGTAQGRLDELGDRIENFVVTLATPIGPLVLRGELSVSRDGDIIFGALLSAEGDPLQVRGSLLVRREYVAASFAGSFDGPFTAGDIPAIAGTLTFSLRHDESGLSGRFAQVFEQGGCIRASEITQAAIDGNRFTAVGRALDGSAIETSLEGIISGGGDSSLLTATFTTRGCGTTLVTGQFSGHRIPGRCPPEKVINYLGAVWNTESGDLLILTMTARFSGRDFIVSRLSIVTPIGPITGTATGRLNEACDRIENLEISLATPVGPLTLRGELSVTPNGRILYGGLRAGPNDPVAFAGSLLVRGL